MKVARFIRAMWGRFPWQLMGNTLVLVIESLIGVVSFLTVAPVIDYFIHPSLEHASLITRQVAGAMRSLGLPVSLGSLLAVFMAFQLLKGGLSVFARWCQLRTKLAVLGDLTSGTFEDFFRARWSFFTGQQQGTLLNTFLHEITMVGEAFSAMARLFAGLIKLACFLTVPVWISWRVTGLSLITALIFAVPFLLLGRVAYRLGTMATAAMNRLSAVIQEALGAAKLVLGFANQAAHARALAASFQAFRRAVLRSQTLANGAPLMYEPLGTLVLVVAMLAAQRFRIPLSEIAVLLWALRSSIPLIGEVMIQRNNLLNFLPSDEQVNALRQRARDLAERSGTRPCSGLREGIRVDGLTFAYPGQGPILRDLTFDIRKGTMAAFVGESGAGKSTLIDLLMGFHEPTQGRILVDGVPLQALDVRAWRRRIGYVPQDSLLFNMSIRDNLRWADNGVATEEEIRQACRQANAEEFIERLPDGYDTVVGDRGVRLSGGQCQRVALARALLKKPDLLILDEATSALDTESERLIQEAIEQVARETTVVIVAHRLSTIARAGAVFVLQGGRIVEAGTYAELVQRRGIFRHMTQMQGLERLPEPQAAAT